MRSIALVALALLAGCQPYSYRAEVTAFGHGVAGLGDALDAAGAAAEAAASRADWARWRRDRRVLAPTNGCIRDLPEGSWPCALVPVGAEPRGPLPATAELRATAPLMRALLGYGAALVAVVEAADGAALAEASDALNATAEALAARLPLPSGRAKAIVGDLAGRSAGALLRAELVEKQLAALRAAVVAADGAVAASSEPLGRAIELALAERLRFVRDELMTLTDEQYRHLRRRSSDAEYDRRREELAAKVDLARRLGEARPRDVLEALVTAHAALRSALTAAEPDKAAARRAIATFSAMVASLRDLATNDTDTSAREAGR